MDQQRRLLLFFTLSLGILIGWSQFVVPIFFPLPPRPDRANLADLLNQDVPVSALFPENVRRPLADAEASVTKIPRHPAKSVLLGSESVDSEFFLAVKLTSMGGSVESIRLNDPRYPEIGKRGTPLTLVGHEPAAKDHTFSMQLKAIDEQLAGETLESVHWELVEHNASVATFRFTAPDGSLTIQKKFSLVPVRLPEQGNLESFRDTSSEGYQLHLDVTLENHRAEQQAVQYVLRGPVGLPLEDPHNSYKHNDVRMGFLRDGGTVDHSSLLAAKVVEQAKAEKPEIWKRPIQYLGVDTQYFAALVHPVADQLKAPTIESSQAVLMGTRKEPRFADVSVLLTSTERELAPGKPLTDQFVLFAGPKRQALLAPLKAESILDLGWFAPVVRIMLAIVHALHAVGLNYGFAILGLTCLVRAVMIPLTLHQARSMEKMKELQPKIKTLHEKYKKDPASLSPDEMRQMQEVNLKMFAGCLPLLAQMPIFIALYRALQVSVDLRMAPFHLFGNWIDNLASPDALFAFGFAIPFLTWTEFNLLPILSIVLMQINQKLTMPPPADEEQAMQYRMMNIMMYVMVIFFYRVPAGLCLYFIMSSVWGTTERLLMKRLSARPQAADPAAELAGSSPQPAAATPAAAVTPEKPSLFSEMKRQFKELQELADKEASIRRADANGNSKGQDRKPNKKRGRG